MAADDELSFSVAIEDAGLRLDVALGAKLRPSSRSYAARLIKDGHVRVDGIIQKPSYKIKSGERIHCSLPPPEPLDLVAEPMDLHMLYEDRHLIVINKAAGLVVHPAAGHASGTLVNGLLHHCPDLEGIGGEKRPGIVHRLDKNTSGALVVAKTVRAHHELSHQFKARKVQKQYLALVHGNPQGDGGRIDLPIGRHPKERKKMSTISSSGREALTVWRVKARFDGVALLEIDLKTGRTHQIRVHCTTMGHPIVGDSVYGSRRRLTKSSEINKPSAVILKNVERQMLHAFRLAFTHPLSGKSLHFEAPLPQDMQRILDLLNQACTASG